MSDQWWMEAFPEEAKKCEVPVWRGDEGRSLCEIDTEPVGLQVWGNIWPTSRLDPMFDVAGWIDIMSRSWPPDPDKMSLDYKIRVAQRCEEPPLPPFDGDLEPVALIDAHSIHNNRLMPEVMVQRVFGTGWNPRSIVWWQIWRLPSDSELRLRLTLAQDPELVYEIGRWAHSAVKETRDGTRITGALPGFTVTVAARGD